jgi:hypothetical protein
VINIEGIITLVVVGWMLSIIGILGSSNQSREIMKEWKSKYIETKNDVSNKNIRYILNYTDIE